MQQLNELVTYSVIYFISYVVTTYTTPFNQFHFRPRDISKKLSKLIKSKIFFLNPQIT